MTNVGIITQARMTSSRLPGKVLLSAGGKSMLAHHVERLQATGFTVIVATTTNNSDDPVVHASEKLGAEVSRGSEHDVLSRFAEAIRAHDLDIVVRVTSDCPLIDSSLIKKGVERFLESKDPMLYLSNTLTRTYPRGFDFEVMSAERLFAADRSATSQYQREHVTPWVYESDDSRIYQMTREQDASNLRITLDTPDDLALILALIEQHDASSFNGEEIVALLQERPDLSTLNAHIEQKKLGS